MTQPASTVPPIPLWLSHLPVVGGLAVPWITPRTEDGRYLFGGLHPLRLRQAITEYLCSVCGRALDRPMVLLMRLADLPRQCVSEPALHPVCAAYTQAACPMVILREFAISEVSNGSNSSADAATDYGISAWVRELRSS